MSIDEAKGATVVFVNPLDIIRFLVKVSTAVVIVPQKPGVFKCRSKLNDLVPILRGVSRIVYFGESTLMCFRDSKIYADVVRGCKKDELPFLSLRCFVSLPRKPHMTFDTSHASLAILYFQLCVLRCVYW